MKSPSLFRGANAKLRFSEQLVVRGAEEAQVLDRVGTALCPRMVVLNLKEGSCGAAVSIRTVIRAAEPIALYQLAEHVVRNVPA